jgi:hypothetical protein
MELSKAEKRLLKKECDAISFEIWKHVEQNLIDRNDIRIVFFNLDFNLNITWFESFMEITVCYGTRPQNFKNNLMPLYFKYNFKTEEQPEQPEVA